ncbi:hypothetical protein SAMN05216198_0921 [Halopseudomonas litoralis]|uniref:Major Facilitator Superfamily protein n=1 Tax=Halopseudomonas litoralis TaxID=797277 RepID=A0A1H1NK66_9GAMM|nr:hypothetical protein SAMN05216198_0921 [Halopseudomonas litoralis]
MIDNNSYSSTPRAWFTVSILLMAYVLSFIDLQVLNLLEAPIRVGLGISDTQVSLLMGLPLAIFYTIAGIPLGRVTDYVFQDDMAIRYSIFWIASVITIGAVVLLRMGIKPYREARETLAAWGERQEQTA